MWQEVLIFELHWIDLLYCDECEGCVLHCETSAYMAMCLLPLLLYSYTCVPSRIGWMGRLTWPRLSLL